MGTFMQFRAAGVSHSANCNVPAVAMPDLRNVATDTQVSYWIGLDGVNTGMVIQAGFNAIKGADGGVSYLAFYESFPDPLVYVNPSDLTVSVGDNMFITVSVNSGGTIASAAFVNMNTGMSYNSPEFVSPDEDADSMGMTAQWVIERAPQTTLADFRTINFRECSAADRGGFQYFLAGGATLELVELGNTLATGSIISDNEVSIEYTGP